MPRSNCIQYGRDAFSALWRASSSFNNILVVCALSGTLSIGAVAQTSGAYLQTNIISDGSTVQALVTDPTLINPWGVSVGPAIWIDKAGNGSVAVATAAGTVAVPSLPSVRIPLRPLPRRRTSVRAERYTTATPLSSIFQVAHRPCSSSARSMVRLPPGM
jgi:hypothetical protein